LEVEVEIGQRLHEREMGQAGLGHHPTLGAGRGFRIQQAIQEIEVRKVSPGSPVRRSDRSAPPPLELQALEVRLHPLVGQAHTDAS
jgi:hypothetical protein